MVGILGQSHGYSVKLNRESGNGRGDIFVYPQNLEKRAYVLELKAAASYREADKEADKAVKQIVDKGYAKALEELGYEDICKVGIAFFRKNCKVRME